MADEIFKEWAILELMGHRVIGGLVQSPGGPGGLAELVRIDIHDGDAVTTQWYGAKSIYCMTPTTEALARAKASGFSAPIHRYELPPAEVAHGGRTYSETEPGFDEEDDLEAQRVDDAPVGHPADFA